MKIRKLITETYLFILLSLFSIGASAVKVKRAFVIVSSQTTATLILDKNEHHLVHTAAGLFADDVNKITGKTPQILTASNEKYQIKVGTLGVNSGFDQECKESGIDTENLKSKWEAYVIKVVPNSGEKTLLVAGSSPRGTAYGLMELSRMIGVSPWCWWADVKPLKKKVIELPPNFYLEDAPKVKFRGIFLNDEDWGLKPWASETFEPETGDIGPKTYGKIFELLLRLKANAVWPAMHACTRAFFTYPGNIKMADKYGIWVGSSHCEPMLRNNVDEWHRWSPTSGERGEWNFDKNPDQLKEYWKQRIDTTANYDGIYTVGMRGIHDGGMPGGKTIADKVEILDHVFKAQRDILGQVTGKEVNTIPQIFCPYKEVLDIYKAGAKVPEDVTIMWADDNNSYIRQLSNMNERKRSGGAGVYYHISYFGRPHDFLWLHSVPVSLIWEEMNKAYQTNAKNVWIANVGDIKPNEIGVDFFLDMAWNPEKYSPANLNSYYTEFARGQFGAKYATQVGEILRKYFQLGFSRKPEHIGWNTVLRNTPVQDPEFSLVNYGDEVQQRIDSYDLLEKETEVLYNRMPVDLKDAFFELVYYSVTGASEMNKKVLYAYKSRVYAQQKRNSANIYAEKADKAFETIKRETTKYNETIANGKWNKMMSFHPRDLPVFDMPMVGRYDPIQEKAGGVVPEGYSEPIVQVPGFASLPVFNSLVRKSYFIDIFNSGKQALKWDVKVDVPWVKISQTSGLLETEIRMIVSIDWDQLPAKDSVWTTVNINLGDKKYRVDVRVLNQDLNLHEKRIFAEDNGVIVMEAENFSGLSNTATANWQRLAGLGRAGDAMGTYPITILPFSETDKKTPTLEYVFSSTSLGEAEVLVYCLPTQPISSEYQVRFSVTVDDQLPTVMNEKLKEEMDELNREWQTNVLSAVSVQTCKINLGQPGKHVLKVSMIDPGVVIDKIVINTGGLKPSYFGPNETRVMW